MQSRKPLPSNEKRIALAFFSDRGGWAMAWITTVSSGRASTVPRSDCLIIFIDPPGRSVRPMEPANNVSPAMIFSRREIEADAAFRMPRRVENAGCVRPCFNRVARAYALIDLDCSGRCHTDHAACMSASSAEHIVLVEQDRRSRSSAKFHGTANVVDMGMRDHDLLTCRLCLRMSVNTSSTSSPGSTTMASRVV